MGQSSGLGLGASGAQRTEKRESPEGKAVSASSSQRLTHEKSEQIRCQPARGFRPPSAADCGSGGETASTRLSLAKDGMTSVSLTPDIKRITSTGDNDGTCWPDVAADS